MLSNVVRPNSSLANVGQHTEVGAGHHFGTALVDTCARPTLPPRLLVGWHDAARRCLPMRGRGHPTPKNRAELVGCCHTRPSRVLVRGTAVERYYLCISSLLLFLSSTRTAVLVTSSVCAPYSSTSFSSSWIFALIWSDILIASIRPCRRPQSSYFAKVCLLVIRAADLAVLIEHDETWSTRHIRQSRSSKAFQIL